MNAFDSPGRCHGNRVLIVCVGLVVCVGLIVCAMLLRCEDRVPVPMWLLAAKMGEIGLAPALLAQAHGVEVYCWIQKCIFKFKTYASNNILHNITRIFCKLVMSIHNKPSI